MPEMKTAGFFARQFYGPASVGGQAYVTRHFGEIVSVASPRTARGEIYTLRLRLQENAFDAESVTTGNSHPFTGLVPRALTR